MDDVTMGVGMILFPQMYQQLSQKDDKEDPKLVAVCMQCGTTNDFPYKFCKECGKPSVLCERLRTCEHCSESFELARPPVCCPYCTKPF